MISKSTRCVPWTGPRDAGPELSNRESDAYPPLVRGTQVVHLDDLNCLEIGSRGFRICLNHFVSRARLSTRGNVSRRGKARGNTHEKTSTKTI